MSIRPQLGLAWIAVTALSSGMLNAQIFSTPQPSSAASSQDAPSSSLPASAPGSQQRASTPNQRSAKRAEISFTGGQLSVKADNSSLNLILREIGRQTGIKITGGVTEERVFGTYGPSSPDEVLAHLLDGTSSNLLLIAGVQSAPGELILTPRLGGATPPNPNAKGFDDDDASDDDAPRTPVPRGVSLFGGAQPTVVPSQPQQPAMAPITQPAASADPSAAQANPQSPNGVKTPQEIYQQLQQLRQQQQQQQQAEPPDGPA